jgi:hypothetical protein
MVPASWRPSPSGRRWREAPDEGCGVGASDRMRHKASVLTCVSTFSQREGGARRDEQMWLMDSRSVAPGAKGNDIANSLSF